MNTAWALVLVMMIGGGKAPETRVVFMNILEMEQCNSELKAYQQLPQLSVDAASGRPIMSRTYLCTPVSPADLQRDLNKLKG
jgi:hypothetical protein